MFEEGDIVVCIDDSFRKSLEFLDEIKLYETYEIVYYNKKVDCVKLKNKVSMYQSNRFITIPEFRKLKINKIRK